MVYRAGPKKERPTAPAESGLVADMVRQFADRYAFVRELVQNGIDAGATVINVSLRHDRQNKALLSVRDDGAGMNRETIEGPLLTLFNSSKENDSSKIGRYGVGFVSVFALQPERVIVETEQANEAWLLEVLPDHSYELRHTDRDAGKGTTVTLLKTLTSTEFGQYAANTHHALQRWCRHACIPINFTVSPAAGQDQSKARVAARIDRPLDLRAAVTHSCQIDTEQYVLGPSAGAHHLWGSEDERYPEDELHFAGFYNRGLTLFETNSPPTERLEGIRFKVMSSELQYTLSRDNVRHDQAYERILNRVEDLVAEPLKRELAAQLGQVADALTAAVPSAPATNTEPSKDSAHRLACEYVALLTAACRPPLWLADNDIAVPLVDPLANQATMSLRSFERASGKKPLVSASTSDLSKAVAASGRPVLYAAHAELAPLLRERLDKGAVTELAAAFALIQQLSQPEMDESDRQLCHHTHQALLAAGSKVHRVRLATVCGAKVPRGAIAVPTTAETESHLRSSEQVGSWWRRWQAAPTLLLLTADRAVARARDYAQYDPVTAANLLARALLVQERGALGKSANDGLLATAKRRRNTRRTMSDRGAAR